MKKGFFGLNNSRNLMHDYILGCVMGQCMMEKMCLEAELHSGGLERQQARAEDQDPVVCERVVPKFSRLSSFSITPVFRNHRPLLEFRYKI